jgi:methyl coenzyme M reductase gamma subunit
VAALLTEPTHAIAAAKAGIGEATLQRWLRLPEFQMMYRQARRQVVEAAVGRLQHATGQAVEALQRALTCGRPSAEIRAAVAILDHSLKAVEVRDLAGQVEELRELVRRMQHERGQAPP